MVLFIERATKREREREKRMGKKRHTQKPNKMILLDHLRPLPPRHLLLQILLVPCQRALLDDPGIRGQIDPVEEALDVADALLQLVDGDGDGGTGRAVFLRCLLGDLVIVTVGFYPFDVDSFRGGGVVGGFRFFAFGGHCCCCVC